MSAEVPQLAQDQVLVASVLQFLEKLHVLVAESNAEAWLSGVKLKVGDLNSSDPGEMNKAFALCALEDAGYLSVVESTYQLQFQYQELIIFFDKNPSERVNYLNLYKSKYK